MSLVTSSGFGYSASLHVAWKAWMTLEATHWPPHQRFVLTEQSDGSPLLQSAVVVTAAQDEYNRDPELQALLAQAVESRAINRHRGRRTT